MLKIYNTLTQTKEPFSPRHPGKVSLYVCGPTVYDFCHLGNARTYAAFDVVVRYLRWQGYEVTYVRNITDIDDKIIKRAQENNEPFMAVVERFTQAMHEDFAALQFVVPEFQPRATHYVPQIVQFIEKLIQANYAYVSENGDVYYSVREFKTYGALSHRDIDQLESGARVEINEGKRDPLDFVLWKLAKPGEPHWPSPWGAGRPGWHIECSVMSTCELGNHFDIHGGGRDLIFPHHENEIAQTQAVTCHSFVNVWMHAGYLQMEKQKMSKSLGNFFTVRDILKTHHPEVLRFFLLSGHYRSSLHYAESALIQSKQSLERLYMALRDLPATSYVQGSSFEEQFVIAMNDDFNTPVAFSILFELAHEIHRLREKNTQQAAEHAALLKYLGNVLGILQSDPVQFLQGGITPVDIEKIEELIAARHVARAHKNWAEADRIRAELDALSVVLEDGPEGTTWKRG